MRNLCAAGEDPGPVEEDRGEIGQAGLKVKNVSKGVAFSGTPFLFTLKSLKFSVSKFGTFLDTLAGMKTIFFKVSVSCKKILDIIFLFC